MENEQIQPAAERLRPMGMLVGTALMWSLHGLLIKWVDLHPLAIAGMRSAIAAVILAAFCRPLTFTWSKAQLGGAVAYALTVITFVLANKMTTAANAILLQYTAPVYVAVFSYWFLKEKITRFDWVTTALVLGGMALFFLDELAVGHLAGNLFALAGGVTYAAFTLFMRKQKNESPLESVLLGNVLTVIVGLPFILTASPTSSGWLGIGILGCMMGVSFIIYSSAVKRVAAIDIILILIIEPLLNPLWVYIIMGETPGMWAALGGAIILGSILMRGIAAATREKPAPDYAA